MKVRQDVFSQLVVITKKLKLMELAQIAHQTTVHQMIKDPVSRLNVVHMKDSKRKVIVVDQTIAMLIKSFLKQKNVTLVVNHQKLQMMQKKRVDFQIAPQDKESHMLAVYVKYV